MFGLNERPLTYPCIINQDIKRRKAKIRTQQYIKLNTRAKEFQQVNPGGPDKQPKHQTPTISPIDKSLSRDRHRVWSPTHRRAIKEESKAANHDRVDHQACSLLQYINVLANLFIMGNYFNELRWKNIRANNLLQFIHKVTFYKAKGWGLPGHAPADSLVPWDCYLTFFLNL